MIQYLELLKTIKEKGTHKPAARANMPGTTSLFGYQFRHNLQEGFPLLITKKIYWKGVVTELLWFLRGDTNIKFLVDNGCNIWNEDAYNYYCKLCKEYYVEHLYTFEQFISIIKGEEYSHNKVHIHLPDCDYKLGDCGYQYGKVWRDWHIVDFDIDPKKNGDSYHRHIDQIKNVINSLKNNPESRRHVVTAWDPAHDQELALTWCHVIFQFNCRPLTTKERYDYYCKGNHGKAVYLNAMIVFDEEENNKHIHEWLEQWASWVPKYYLDCQLYQRSCDFILGGPFNIASYALLTHIIAAICDYLPGDFVHSFGDVHVYDNHFPAMEEQLKRIPGKLPTLKFSDWFINSVSEGQPFEVFDEWIKSVNIADFIIENYNPQSSIKAPLSTGL